MYILTRDGNLINLKQMNKIICATYEGDRYMVSAFADQKEFCLWTSFSKDERDKIFKGLCLALKNNRNYYDLKEALLHDSCNN